MRMDNKNSFSSTGFFKLKGQDWLEKQRRAGRLAAYALKELQAMVAEKADYSLLAMNDIVEALIIKGGGTPTFKGYKGFPAGVCISVNKQLVHGIPTDYKLQEGDVVSFDLGVTIEGAIADTAITCIYGEPKTERHAKLVKSTEEALMCGIRAIAVGNKLGCIGNAISRYAKGQGFNVINNYGGHGLDWDTPHAPPFVANKASLEDGFRIQPGLAIAIEPMLVLGSTLTKTSEDGWTVMTDDVGAHFEHSIFVHEDRVEIITDRN